MESEDSCVKRCLYQVFLKAFSPLSIVHHLLTFHANSLATFLLYPTTYDVTTESSIPYSSLVSAPLNLGLLFGFCISRRAKLIYEFLAVPEA
jgi:hypothetical protein